MLIKQLQILKDIFDKYTDEEIYDNMQYYMVSKFSPMIGKNHTSKFSEEEFETLKTFIRLPNKEKIANLRKSTDNEIKNVIAHELIHCIPECNNHGTPYKLKAFEARKLGYNVFCDDGMITFNKATKTVSQHIYKCEKCGKEYSRIRRVNTDKYRCPCGGHLHEV